MKSYMHNFLIVIFHYAIRPTLLSFIHLKFLTTKQKQVLDNRKLAKFVCITNIHEHFLLRSYISHDFFKVEKILKGSLDSIPSPSTSVKIQIMGGKVCLRCKGKTLLGVVNKLLETKSLLTLPSYVLPLHL